MADSSDVHEAKARSFEAQADKRLQSGGLKSWFEDKSAKYQDAAELYNKAANFYKLSKNMDKAGEVYLKAGNNFAQTQQKHDAASAYQNAAQAYIKSNPDGAVDAMKRAVDLYLDEGRFNMAAKAQKEIAEMFEKEQKLEQAMDSFTKAADYYESENSPSNAQSCRLKVAHFAASLGQFDKATEIFETCASAAADNKLLKFSVREYLLKASFCLLAAGDLVGAKRAATEKYPSLCFEWSGSKESKFVEELVAAIEAYDQDAFTAAVQDFDSTNRLDQWKTNILLKVKETIKEETDLT